MGREKISHHWIAASFLLVGALLAFLAWDRGGAYWPLLWPAADCLLVGSAYYAEEGRVFGKREDGSFYPPRRLLMLPFLAVLRTVWELQVRSSFENAWDEAADGVFVGRQARSGEYPPRLDCAVDLTSEFPRPDHHPEGSVYLCLPVLDAFVPDDAAFERMVKKAAAHKRVLVHCANGHGRSALFCAALLLERGLADSVEEAWAAIAAARPRCALNPVQTALLRRFAAARARPREA